MVEQELDSGVAPDRIGYVSFTRRAADEAIGRATEKFGLERKDLPFFRTLHSLCFRVLGISSSQVLEGTRLEAFGDLVGHKVTGRFSLDEGTVFGFEKGDRLLFMENLARVRRVPLQSLYNEDDDDMSWWEVDRFARSLADYKRENDLLDYTDMLEQFLSTEAPALEVLFVDEAQDLSLLQWDVVRKLAESARRVVIAGDDDQAIYRWAGADVETLVGMAGKVTVLSQSWRVPVAVQKVADAVVGRIKNRRPKEWAPRQEEGLVKYHAHADSVDLSGQDILILGRNRYLLREFENTIRSSGYLYEFQGNRSIRPRLLEAVLAWERLRQGKSGVLAVDARRMYEFMSMGTGWKRGQKLLPDFDDEEEVTIDLLQKAGGLLIGDDKYWYDALDKMAMQDIAYIRAALRRKENLLAPPRIRLSTIHGMKGGEARMVVLLTDMAARTFEEARKAPEDEARVWYVAVTRAREELHIVAPSTKRYYQL